MIGRSRDTGHLGNTIRGQLVPGYVVAENQQSRDLLHRVHQIAPSRATVLIQGESGTGKELIARLIHFWSDRAAGPFVAVSCKAFADGVLESELFGHEKGSFTGAIAPRAGCFERASEGTLFLDEIGGTSLEFQAKLLRVLQEGEVLRVGGTQPRKVNTRVVAATNRLIRDEIAAGRFREDLFFRLNVIPILIPPLRDRREDILPLARHFLSSCLYGTGRHLHFTPAAEEALPAHSWPGNVRELENAIERAAVFARGNSITPEDLSLDPTVEPHLTALEGTLRQFVRDATTARVAAALREAKGNRAEAARALGIDRTTLYRLMKRLPFDSQRIPHLRGARCGYR